MNLRARFVTGADGCYHFRTVKPVSYPVPTDGPVGAMLTRMGRHPYRPAHIHLIVTHAKHETLVTHMFAKGDPYLESDAVFGVKESLIVDFVESDDPQGAARLGVSVPFCSAGFDVRLAPKLKP